MIADNEKRSELTPDDTFELDLKEEGRIFKLNSARGSNNKKKKYFLNLKNI
jgi:hypothetical protein